MEKTLLISQELADKYGLSYGKQDRMLMGTKCQNPELLALDKKQDSVVCAKLINEHILKLRQEGIINPTFEDIENRIRTSETDTKLQNPELLALNVSPALHKKLTDPPLIKLFKIDVEATMAKTKSIAQ